MTNHNTLVTIPTAINSSVSSHVYTFVPGQSGQSAGQTYDGSSKLVYSFYSTDRSIKFQAGTWADESTTQAPNQILYNSTNGFVEIGDVNGGNQDFGAFTSPFYSSSGPTVTSITVANEIASTRQFTVTHTGTLSASDISYIINDVDITSLGSPNTPITNLQTTSTGSTFDSFTVSKNGLHLITIGSEVLSFIVQTTTSQTYTPIPTTTVLASFPGNTLSSRPSHGQFVQFTSSNNDSFTIRMLSDTTCRLESAITDSTYTYFISISHSPTFTLGNQETMSFIKSTSTNGNGTTVRATSISVLDWVYAAANSAAATTTNGGGKRRRYPIISTNLFDRQRSIFSIGNTHKDETLFNGK